MRLVLRDVAVRVGADDALSGGDVAQSRAELLDRSGLEKDAGGARVDQLPQRFRRRAAGHDGDLRRRAPAARLEQHFEPRCARHHEVEHRAVGRKPLDLGNCLDAVRRDADNLESVHGLDDRAGSVNGQRVIVGDDDAGSYVASPPKHREPRSVLPAAVFFACFALIFQFSAAQAQDRKLILDGPVGADAVGRHTDLLLDEDHALDISDVMGDFAGDFAPIATRVPDVGYTDAMVWLRLKVANATPGTSEWRLYFKENFKQIFHVHIVDADGAVSHPLAQDIDSPFSTRAVAYPEVVVPLILAPGEEAAVYVRFWTEGATYLPLYVETTESFIEISTRNAAKQFVFYGMMLILIVAAMLAGLVLRHPIFPAYIGYSASTLLYIMHADGVAFQYLWPGFPAFNSYASVAAGGSYAVFGAIYARIFLNTAKYHPVVDKLLVAVTVVVLAMMATGVFFEPRIIKKTLILVVLFAIGLFTAAALLAARKRFKQVRFYVFAWLGATGSALLMALRHWVGIDVSQEFQHDSMRVVMIFDAVMMGLAIVDRFNQLREERQNALRLSLEQAERNLDMNTRLRNLEARYDLAVETAGRHQQHIENTVHDIRQPLHALRLAVQGIMNDRKPGPDKDYGDVYESFDYLEALVAGHLEGPDAGPSAESVGDMQLGDILRSVHEMFLPDAEAKGLAFSYVPTGLATPIQPLALMRIFSNLVSNAIKYTGSGKLLLGARRLKDAVRVELHDTGPGLSAEEFDGACKRGSRLDPALTIADGEGYGLAIVVELAKRHGYALELLNRDSPGTSIGLTIPLPAAG
jgi:signal transduction histidine kinase